MNNGDIQVENLVLEESFQQFCMGTDKAATEYWEGWLQEHPDKRAIFFKAKQLYLILNGANDSFSFKKDKAAFQEFLIEKGILEKEAPEPKVVKLPDVGASTKKISVYRFFAAASILIAVVFGGYLVLKNNNQLPQVTDGKISSVQKFDKAPGTDKATLTLADGTTIGLDSTNNGVISQQDGIKVINMGGLLSYQGGNKSAEVLFNTISTPNGGQYKLLLEDGSRVWLNASSSLRFPTVFQGTERQVELTGEGYFEVAHYAAKPFKVLVKGMEVTVLGTHFNINAYDDEAMLKTTLVEGSVMVKKENIVYLHPGQQAILNNRTGQITLDPNVDVEEEVAWKNGKFIFNGSDIPAVMRQLQRWYDVEVEYRGVLSNEKFVGVISRDVNISQILEMLENTRTIKFEMKGRTIIVY